jgi:hypothetical protein
VYVPAHEVASMQFVEALGRRIMPGRAAGMSGPRGGAASIPTPSAAARLPRRDIVLLPAIALLTWLSVTAAAETLARLCCPEQKIDACHLPDETGGRFRANCHAETKLAEGAWAGSDYNDCGYRSAHSCKAAPAGTLRVAVLGTSISRGYWVSYDHSFAGRVERDLTAACARPVDLQNLALFGSTVPAPGGVLPVWHHVADRAGEALALRPTALVLVMAPFDLEDYQALPPALPDAAHPARLLGRVEDAARDMLNASRFMLLARHYAFRDPDRYAVNYLRRGDMTGYLRPPFSPTWSLRLQVADATIARIAAQAGAAGIPLIVALMPQRAQAVLSRNGADRHGTDPFALGEALAAIARAHHADFIDVTDAMRTEPDPAALFFVVDGHPNGAGHAVLARAIEGALQRDVAGFSGCVSRDR